ncbi:hypothetical protein ACWEF9_00820 [Streptomyces sp. NPDC004980]
MTERVPEVLRSRPDLAELAAFSFDFEVCRAYHVEGVDLASGATPEPIAGDDTGGTFFLCGEGKAALHVSSEGDAALLADGAGEAPGATPAHGRLLLDRIGKGRRRRSARCPPGRSGRWQVRPGSPLPDHFHCGPAPDSARTPTHIA